MIKFLKVENIIIGEARAANPYDCSNNGTRRGSDTEYSNHRARGKYKVGSLLDELSPEEREELKDFTAERLTRTEVDSNLRDMERIGRQFTPKKKSGRWGL